jgi:small multidrug resistance pump
LRTGWFYLGFALYASTAIGVVLFRESLNYFEVIGIVFAVVSLVLLMRFA